MFEITINNFIDINLFLENLLLNNEIKLNILINEDKYIYITNYLEKENIFFSTEYYFIKFLNENFYNVFIDKNIINNKYYNLLNKDLLETYFYMNLLYFKILVNTFIIYNFLPKKNNFKISYNEYLIYKNRYKEIINNIKLFIKEELKNFNIFNYYNFYSLLFHLEENKINLKLIQSLNYYLEINDIKNKIQKKKFEVKQYLN